MTVSFESSHFDVDVRNDPPFVTKTSECDTRNVCGEGGIRYRLAPPKGDSVLPDREFLAEREKYSDRLRAMAE